MAYDQEIDPKKAHMRWATPDTTWHAPGQAMRQECSGGRRAKQNGLEGNRTSRSLTEINGLKMVGQVLGLATVTAGVGCSLLHLFARLCA